MMSYLIHQVGHVSVFYQEIVLLWQVDAQPRMRDGGNASCPAWSMLRNKEIPTFTWWTTRGFPAAGIAVMSCCSVRIPYDQLRNYDQVYFQTGSEDRLVTSSDALFYKQLFFLQQMPLQYFVACSRAFCLTHSWLYLYRALTDSRRKTAARFALQFWRILNCPMPRPPGFWVNFFALPKTFPNCATFMSLSWHYRTCNWDRTLWTIPQNHQVLWP